MSRANLIATIHASKPKRSAFPRRDYNHNLAVTFESSENENRWSLLTQSKRYMKPIVSCLIPHKETLFSLDVKTKIYTLFDRVHLSIDDIMGLPTYKVLAYEFVASFSITHGKTPYGEGSEWNFRIQNTNFTWTREQAIYFLNFTDGGEFPTPPVHQLKEFWNKLTGSADFGPKSSPYAIKDEAWQYTHRLIATNINCHPETVDYVTVEDLDLLWAMDEGKQIDWFKMFTLRFLSMQYMNGARRFVGCTSVITLIAQKCGFRFNDVPAERRSLDFARWRKMKIIARPIELDLTDVSEESDNEKEGENEVEQQTDKKRKVEEGREINEKIEWDKVRRIVVYEF